MPDARDTINALVRACHGNSVDHGFWKRDDETLATERQRCAGALVRFYADHGMLVPGNVEAILDALVQEDQDPMEVLPLKLMLIVTELGEAMEAYREGDQLSWTDERGKPQGIASELADVVIRVFDLAGGLSLDLGQMIVDKMAYNAGRSFRHGNKKA